MLKAVQTVTDIQPDAPAVAIRVARWLLKLAKEAEGRFAVCLSGGSTPRLLYETLADKQFADSIPWEKIHWFWGDERYVPHSDPLSNFKMVYEAMLSKCPVPAKNIHPMKTDLKDANAAAVAYENELKAFYGAERLDPDRPLFDVTLLGLGPDGHTASLFPGTPVLNEHIRWVSAVVGVKPETRLTLTYPALESSRAAAFLVTGREKKDMVKQILTGSSNLPAARVRPVGTLHWFFDESAYPRT